MECSPVIFVSKRTQLIHESEEVGFWGLAKVGKLRALHESVESYLSSLHMAAYSGLSVRTRNRH